MTILNLLERLYSCFLKIKNGREKTIKKSNIFFIFQFNLSLGYNFEYKNNPIIKYFIKMGINFII
jgi:hypothetical protein